LEDAISRVCPEIDLILCNVAFDSSRMFDLLRAVRSREAGRTAPIIFFRLRPLSKASHHALELCAHEFERVSFVDLHEVAEKDGMPAALLALREAVYREIRGDLAG
jgi:hypothetical protein